MKNKLLANCGIPTFDDIVKNNLIYVDKTSYLVKMLEGGSIKTWFLARPRRFGKSLTISTLEALFLGQEELFQGLAIEKRFKEKFFSPRPVIHLDMSHLTMTKGIEAFELSLLDLTTDLAEKLGITLPQSGSSATAFRRLITKCKDNSGSMIAVLIDEYDTPVTDLLDKPDEMEKVRETLREFYRQLKACDKYISFVFVTGITKFVQGGLYSAFNNPTDITLNRKYGALTGFTHEELEKYYDLQLEEAAKTIKIPKKKLLEQMKYYYNGFCFDGQTLVYNPFSTLLFFEEEEFSNFWFNSGTPDQLIQFFKEAQLTVEQFRYLSVDKDRIRNPRQSRYGDPATYLFQLGYLSLRPSQVENEYVLDYPNLEVRQSMARRVLESYFDSPDDTQKSCVLVKQSLSERNTPALVDELNRFLSIIPYDYYTSAEKRDEGFYSAIFFTLFYAIGIDPQPRKHGNQGRSDFVVEYGRVPWIIEVKICHNNKGDNKLADTALKKIKETNYDGGFRNPVLLGLVVNDTTRSIKSWKCEGGILKTPEKEEKENDRSGPRPF
jgi:hypothetical protein